MTIRITGSVLVRNCSPVAQLVPDRRKVCTGNKLARALAKIELPNNEAAAWNHDLKSARKILKDPARKWQ
jgi:hypothetical protein